VRSGAGARGWMREFSLFPGFTSQKTSQYTFIIPQLSRFPKLPPPTTLLPTVGAERSGSVYISIMYNGGRHYVWPFWDQGVGG